MNRKEFERLMQDRFCYSTRDLSKFLGWKGTERKYRFSEMQLLWEVTKCVNWRWKNKIKEEEKENDKGEI